MGMVAKLLEQRGQIQNPDRWFIRHLLGSDTVTGRNVDQDSALSSTALLAGLKRIAGDVASVPLKVKERTGPRQKRDARDHAVWQVLRNPNPEQTGMDFREMVTGFYLSAGNGYAEIVRDGGAEVRELWPITPHRVTPKRDARGRLWYEVTLPGGGSELIPPENMLHIKGFSRNGILGLDTIQQMRESIGLTLALEEFSGRFFSNGSALSGFLKHPSKLSAEGHNKLAADFKAKFSGLRNMHRTLILEEGMEWTPAGVPPETAQMLESRKFQISEAARILMIPPHLLGDLERATFSNVEQQFIEYQTLCLRHHFVRWEGVAEKRLLLPSEQERFYFKHITQALLQTTTKERYDAYAVALGNGFLSPNDIRELEDLNPVEGGDVYLAQLNLIPLPAIGDLPGSSEGSEPAADGDGDRSVLEGRSFFRLEARGRRSVTERLRLRGVHGRQIRRSAERAVDLEVKLVRKILGEELGRRSLQGFTLKLEDAYSREVRPKLVEKLKPALLAYASAIWRAASEEVNGDAEVPADLVEFISIYAENVARRHVTSSQNQIRNLILEAGEEAAIVEAVEGRLDEWAEKRPGKIASWEAVEAEGAVTKKAYAAAGILGLQWVANGEDCPLCTELDGKIIGIQDAFLKKGDTLDPGGTSPLQASRRFTHAPIHEGCDCSIVAARL